MATWRKDFDNNNREEALTAYRKEQELMSIACRRQLFIDLAVMPFHLSERMRELRAENRKLKRNLELIKNALND